MGDAYVRSLPFLLLFTSLLAAEVRLLRWSVWAYGAQGWLLALLLAGIGWFSGNEALYAWAATVAASKGLILPWLLGRYVRGGGPGSGFGVERKAPPLAISLTAAALAGAAAFLLADRFGGWLLEGLSWERSWSGVPGLQIAAAILAVGSWTLLAHRDVAKTVIGVCLVENSVHLALVSLAPSLPETGEVGIVTDVILAVWLLLAVARGAAEAAGSRDTAAYRRLAG